MEWPPFRLERERRQKGIQTRFGLMCGHCVDRVIERERKSMFRTLHGILDKNLSSSLPPFGLFENSDNEGDQDIASLEKYTR